MVMRLLAVAVVAVGLSAAGVASAATYDYALDIGDQLIVGCGSSVEVTLYGPGLATVACVKGGSAEGGAVDSATTGEADSLVTYIDLNAGEDIDVSCPGTFSIDWGGALSMVCGL